MPVTLQTIARLAKCSQTTAALALRNDSQIRPGLRNRIQALAKEQAYQPDNILHGACKPESSGGSAAPTLGTLHTVTRRFAVETPWYADWMMGAADRGAQMGYFCEDFWLQESETTAEEVEKALTSRRIQGLLLPSFPAAERLPLEFRPLLEQYPAAVAGYPCAEVPAVPVVASDPSATGEALLERAVQAGYQRIGFVVAERADVPAPDHVNESSAMLLPSLSRPSLDEEEFLTWMSMYRPDCVVTTASEVWTWLRGAGWRVPEDIGFLFWQRSQRGQRWSGMSENDREVGATALELIVQQLRGGPEIAAQVQSPVWIESTWVDGQTIRSAA